MPDQPSYKSVFGLRFSLGSLIWLTLTIAIVLGLSLPLHHVRQENSQLSARIAELETDRQKLLAKLDRIRNDLVSSRERSAALAVELVRVKQNERATSHYLNPLPLERSFPHRIK
jgi:uncharacterized membrane-anchored protein YhcB (DUF1043 family)